VSGARCASVSRRTVVWASLLAGFFTVAIEPASAYLKFGVTVDGRSLNLKWARTPVQYRVSERGIEGITPSQLRDAVGRAFNAWQAVPTASIAYEFGGFTSARPGDDDSFSTLGFDDRPDLDRVLASTTLLIDETTGELVEADIFFNTAFAWSVAADGEAGKFDLETIALHEIGHFSGLGHSALGETELTEFGRRVLSSEAVMFPIAFGPGNIANRTLRPDDVAGISDLYPDGDWSRDTGSLSGHIAVGGSGIFGAHVVAFSPQSAALIASFALGSAGQFSIAGLTPGLYIVRVEPLDDADVESFFDAGTDVALDFGVTFHDRLVVVPRGGDSGDVAIEVALK
jgi:hypothetical protein